jgi:hypothetical protein
MKPGSSICGLVSSKAPISICFTMESNPTAYSKYPSLAWKQKSLKEPQNLFSISTSILTLLPKINTKISKYRPITCPVTIQKKS